MNTGYIPRRIYFGNELVKIGIMTEWSTNINHQSFSLWQQVFSLVLFLRNCKKRSLFIPLGGKFLSASGAFLVSRSESSYDAFRAEAMQTLFCCHCVVEHVKTDGTHEFRVKGSWWHCNLGPISYSFLWDSIEFVIAQLPCFCSTHRRHCICNSA